MALLKKLVSGAVKILYQHIVLKEAESEEKPPEASVDVSFARMSPKEQKEMSDQLAVESLSLQRLDLQEDPFEQADMSLVEVELVSLHFENKVAGGSNDWLFEFRGKDIDGSYVHFMCLLPQRRVNALGSLLASGPHFRQENGEARRSFESFCVSKDCECCRGVACSNCVAEKKPGQRLLATNVTDVGTINGWFVEQPEDRSLLTILFIPLDRSRQQVMCEFQLDALKRLAWALPQSGKIHMRASGVEPTKPSDFFTVTPASDKETAKAVQSFCFDLTADCSVTDVIPNEAPPMPPTPGPGVAVKSP